MGVEVWNRWREEHPYSYPDLFEADLSGMHLRGADLRGAPLTGADFFEADLSEADLSGAHLFGGHLIETVLSRANLGGADLGKADLSRTNLSGADLRGTNLSRANLVGASLRGADLSGTNLSRANLVGANLSGTYFGSAHVENTHFSDIDLSEAKGLDEVFHLGPSHISISTIYKSKGKIPEVFLRGCGVPENFIEYMGSLVGKAWEYYSCFISYSSKNEDFAKRLYESLQAKGVRCWFAPEDVQGGKKLYEQIPTAIRAYDKLLLVLSEQSMASEWVKTEIYHARQEELRTDQRKLFPISLVTFEEVRRWSAFDADVGKDMAREVREYYVPDFSRWKEHDSYQKALERLVRDLKAEGN